MGPRSNNHTVKRWRASPVAAGTWVRKVVWLVGRTGALSHHTIQHPTRPSGQTGLLALSLIPTAQLTQQHQARFKQKPDHCHKHYMAKATISVLRLQHTFYTPCSRHKLIHRNAKMNIVLRRNGRSLNTVQLYQNPMHKKGLTTCCILPSNLAIPKQSRPRKSVHSSTDNYG